MSELKNLYQKALNFSYFPIIQFKNKLMIDNFLTRALHYHLYAIVNELFAYISHLFIFGYKIRTSMDTLELQEYLFF